MIKIPNQVELEWYFNYPSLAKIHPERFVTGKVKVCKYRICRIGELFREINLSEK